MSESDGFAKPGKRRAKRFLNPSQKYEIWLQLIRQEVTIAEAVVIHRVGHELRGRGWPASMYG